jgi:hypothetical protein
MKFRRGHRPLADLVEGLSEIKSVTAVQISKDDND